MTKEEFCQHFAHVIKYLDHSPMTIDKEAHKGLVAALEKYQKELPEDEIDIRDELKEEPGLTKNKDGTYLSEGQIVNDLIKKAQNEGKDAINSWKQASDDDIALAHHSMGQNIRNKYGFWRDDNQHVTLNPKPNEHGVVDHPNFPDQMSDRIMKTVRDRLRILFPT